MSHDKEVARVLRIELQALELGLRRIETDPKTAHVYDRAIDQMAHVLERSGKIIVMGLGKSGKVAQKTAATFCSTGSLAVYLHPSEALHGDLGVVSSNDVVLAFSQSGNTEEIAQLLPSLQKRRVSLIALSGNSRSKLVESADLWIDTSVEQEACPYNLAPTASSTLALAIGDALALGLMKKRGIQLESFAANHPGGGLGKRLHSKVSDLMHPVSTITKAFVLESASIEDVVEALTQGRLGAICVVQSLEGKKLLGIITEGDLRRALKHRDRFFSLSAKDIMTHQPVQIEPDEMAHVALALMEKRTNQISVLPVVQKGVVKGLIRLHDLVQNLS